MIQKGYPENYSYTDYVRELEIPVDSSKFLEHTESVESVPGKGYSVKNIYLNGTWSPGFDHTNTTGDFIKRMIDSHSVNRVSLRTQNANSLYTVHNDHSDLKCVGRRNLHVVIHTNPYCYFVYPHNEIQQLWSMSRTDCVYSPLVCVPHTFINAGLTPRIHLVMLMNRNLEPINQ